MTTPKLWDVRDLIVFAKAKRHGNDQGKPWLATFRLMQTLRKAESREDSTRRMIGILGRVPDTELRLRLLDEYMSFLSTPSKGGRFANPETFRQMVQDQALVYDKVQRARKKGSSLEDAFASLSEQRSSKNNPRPGQRHRRKAKSSDGLKKAYYAHKKRWGV